MEGRFSRPALLGLYHAVQLGSDRVEVCNAGRSVVLTAPGKAEALVAFLHACDGTASLTELSDRFRDLAVGSLVESLDARGLLTEGGDPSLGSGRARAAIALHNGTAADPAQQLRDATVLLAGCGPVGALTAVNLAKACVGSIVLVDDGLVSANDVIACPVFDHQGVGHTRSEVVAQACAASDAVSVSTGGDAEVAMLDGVTMAIIQATYGDTGIVAPVADAALHAAVAHIVHHQDALELVVGPVIEAGGRPCHHCMESRRLSHVAHLDEHLAYLAHRSLGDPEPDAFLAAHTSLAAGLLATRVLQHLTGSTPDGTRGTALVLDLATSEWRRERVLEVPGCAGCAAAARRDSEVPAR